MFNVKRALDFALFGPVYVILSLFIHPQRNSRKKIIGFASRQFKGNIKYLYLEMARYPNVQVYYVTDDKNRAESTRKREGIDSRYYMDVKAVPLFLRTHIWVTSESPYYIPFVGFFHNLTHFYRGKHGSKWVDVWHGMGFKDVGRAEMLRTYNYDLGIVTSEFFRDYFSKKGFPSKKLKITGFPRNDPLIDQRWSKEEIERQLGIPIGRKNILYAPTWGHKRKKSLFPWEATHIFLEEIEHFCERNNCNFLIRMHINWYIQHKKESQLLDNLIKNAKNVFHFAPYEYEDVQPLLFISSVLITDWSSIANDFLLLNRPIIFLDVEFPVEEFVLSPEDRAGYIVRNKHIFFEKLKESLDYPEVHQEKRREILKKLYRYLDGNASKRCAEEIFKLLEE